MPELKIRKYLVSVEEIFHEGGPVASIPYRRASALAVIRNPFAGTYHADIQSYMDVLKPLGLDLARRIEHGALWHVPGGYAMRELLGDAKAIVPSAKKVGAPGTRIDVPVTHINASYVRSHFDAIEAGIPDAPRADEMVMALVMTTGPRVHARVGGLAAKDIVGKDGLR